MQPSIFCPHVDITRSTLGFGRIGLRLLNRDLHSPDQLVQLQALHTLMDQIQISENALFLINLQVVCRLIDLMKNKNPIVREKVCLIYTYLTTYYQAREQIVKLPKIADNLMWHILNDIKEIRYAAAYNIWTLTRYHITREMLMKIESLVFNLLKKVKSDHVEIVILHLKTLTRLAEHDPEPPLRSNGFHIMRKLCHAQEPRLVAAAMNLMTQMCKHPVGRKLADLHFMTWKCRKFLNDPSVEVVIAALGLIQYTSVTTAVKFRAREFFPEILTNLVQLCHMSTQPNVQLQCMQTLINLCDSPDIRISMRACYLESVKCIQIITPTNWDGSSDDNLDDALGCDSGHYYRTVYVKNYESIGSYIDDNVNSTNVHNYLKRLNDTKVQLINAINHHPYKD